jgi:hypothetical protein
VLSPIGQNLPNMASYVSRAITACDAFSWRKLSKTTVQYDLGTFVILHVLHIENVGSFIFDIKVKCKIIFLWNICQAVDDHFSKALSQSSESGKCSLYAQQGL